MTNDLRYSRLQRIAAELEKLDGVMAADNAQIDRLQNAVRAAQDEAKTARCEKTGTAVFWFLVGAGLGFLAGASAVVFFTH